jgi:hypothetical protein
MQPIIPIVRHDPFDDPAYLFELKLDGRRHRQRPDGVEERQPDEAVRAPAGCAARRLSPFSNPQMSTRFYSGTPCKRIGIPRSPASALADGFLPHIARCIFWIVRIALCDEFTLSANSASSAWAAETPFVSSSIESIIDFNKLGA